MTVQQLITWLQKFDPKATIYESHYIYQIGIIEHEGTFSEKLTIPYVEAIETDLPSS